MKKFTTTILGLMILIAAQVPSWGIGDNRMRIKVDKKKLTAGTAYAVIGFNGGTVVSGNMGLGSLVSGALANKSDSGKLNLDETYFNDLYDSLTKTLSNEGYTFVPAEKVKASPAYQSASEVSLPSTMNAKGLKFINTNKSDDLKKIAAETGANRLFAITVGHSLGMRSNIGVIAGKQVGVATVMIVVFDENGKKLGFIDGSDTSDTAAGAVAGGYSDPAKVKPMLKEADSKLVAALAAAVSKKGN